MIHTIIINIVLWFIIHMSLSYIMILLPSSYINIKSWIYKDRKWELNGKIYEDIFKIKRWKGLLPDGAALFKKGFRKKQLVSSQKEYLTIFILETCRAELAHWLVILFSPVFFIWNPLWAGFIMIVYALFANLPCIYAQRYNRFRFQRILKDK
ncbi:MAG: glycosyl-4,4'-diaponeurosporenoate acyltransferase [Bacteroidetes bacterium]|nr:glycosyl-4,4'-diaponeurosporenoate acyltransferase [Bacteroidota bacterium]